MTIHAAPRCAPAIKPLALAFALSVCFTAPAYAQTSHAHRSLVTGARFASDPSLSPIGATVITADEIRRAGVTDVNQAIRKIGGVYGRQSLDGSPDFSLDLRGFGSNSSQNMVVVLDGVRMSENELSGPMLSTIPIDTVERIEIMRGGASVLYGEGATGGVIQIVTKRAATETAAAASLSVEARPVRPARRCAPAPRRSWDALCARRRGRRPQAPTTTATTTRFDQTAASAAALQWSHGGGRVGAARRQRAPGVAASRAR